MKEAKIVGSIISLMVNMPLVSQVDLSFELLANLNQGLFQIDIERVGEIKKGNRLDFSEDHSKKR